MRSKFSDQIPVNSLLLTSECGKTTIKFIHTTEGRGLGRTGMHLSTFLAVHRCLFKTTSAQPTSTSWIGRKEAGLGMAIAIIATSLVTPAWANQPRLNDVSPPGQHRAAVFQLLFVDPIAGDDRSDGGQRSPLRSITRAVQLAQPNTVILLAAGTYSAQTGERFPITLPPNVSLQENPASEERGVTIQGDVVGGQLSPTIVTSRVTENPTAAVNRAAAASTPTASSFLVLTGDYPPGTLAPRSQFRPTTRSSAALPNPERPNAALPNTELPNTVVVPASPFRTTSSAGRTTSSAVTSRADSAPIAPVRGVSISVRPPTVAPSPTAHEPMTAPPVAPPSRRVASSAQSSVAIPIPVPPPVSSGRYRLPGGVNASQGGMGTAASTPPQAILNFQASVEVPVSAPAGQVATAERQSFSSRRDRASRTAARSSPAPRYDLLPVPDPNAPLGNIGTLPTITVSGAGAGALRRSPPTTPVASRAAELGLRYRVVVNARDRSVQERVLQLFPAAFLTYDDDQDVVMQVGAFNERDNAEEVETVLDQNGIRARVERVD